MVIIDSSKMINFKEVNAQEYLEIIKNIIDLKLSTVRLGEIESP
jgi:hypothetical protein